MSSKDRDAKEDAPKKKGRPKKKEGDPVLYYVASLARRSSHDIDKRFKAAWFKHYNNPEIRFNGGRATHELINSAAVDMFLSLPIEEQAKHIIKFIPKYEKSLNTKPPGWDDED